MTNPQIEMYTQKVDNFMAKYPKFTGKDAFKKLEEATGYPAAWFFLAACVLLTGILTVLGGAKLLVDLVGFVYPAYMSFKSMDGNGDDTQWLTYWVCFSAMNLTENMLFFVTALIPMYFWLKIAIIVWMWHPNTRGAQTIYDQLLRPLLLPYLDGATASNKKE